MKNKTLIREEKIDNEKYCSVIMTKRDGKEYFGKVSLENFFPHITDMSVIVFLDKCDWSFCRIRRKCSGHKFHKRYLNFLH